MVKQASKVRDSWFSFITVYTQLSRLHRLISKEETREKLDEKSLEAIQSICAEFDKLYQPKLCELWSSLADYTETVQIDYAYTRYKTLCMAVHTPTSMPSAFAADIGLVAYCIDDTDEEKERMHMDRRKACAFLFCKLARRM